MVVIGLAVAMMAAACGGAVEGNIHAAAYEGDLAKMKQLVAGGVDINLRDKKKVTPLHLAAFQGNKHHIAMTKWLLANGANVNLTIAFGDTPLDWAVRNKKEDVAAILRNHGGKTGAELETGGK